MSANRTLRPIRIETIKEFRVINVVYNHWLGTVYHLTIGNINDHSFDVFLLTVYRNELDDDNLYVENFCVW